MIDFYGLLKDTNAYKIVKGDKENGRLSHAYLFVTPDGDNLLNYLKVLAKTIVCEDGSPCLNCRKCKLIDKEEYVDAMFFPKNGDTVTAEDVSLLIDEAYLKPIEGKKKIFIINHGENLSALVQNKLLKTIEEPPENVYLLIGAVNDYAILPTVKSRAKKISAENFTDEVILNALKTECEDTEKLKYAVSCASGSVGEALKLYDDENLKETLDFSADMIVNMQSSKDVLTYSVKAAALKDGVNGLLSALEIVFRDLLVGRVSPEKVKLKDVFEKVKNAKGYSDGAIINALDKINEAQKRNKFNANPTMLTEWLMLQILEGKYKWQKLSE